VSVEECTDKLNKLGGKYGDVTSLLVREDASKRLYAFMCFKSLEEAEKAF
jgi:hypothetical protein